MTVISYVFVFALLSYPSLVLSALRGTRPFLVKLWKEHVNETNTSDHGGGYFIGAIHVGGPVAQELHVAFTTTTGMVVLPSPQCSGEACKRHRRYDPLRSDTSVDLQMDGTRADPSGGQRARPDVQRSGVSLDFVASKKGADSAVKGYVVSDKVCLGNRHGSREEEKNWLCATASLVIASEINGSTLDNMPQDGMVGLGLRGLAPAPHLQFVQSLNIVGLQTHFGLYVADDAHSAELTFGGHDETRLLSKPLWVPVSRPDTGHWLVDIVGIKIGGVLLDMCNDNSLCRGIVHSSAPKMQVPEELKDKFFPSLDKAEGIPGCPLPTINFMLKNGVVLEIRAEDYAGPGCKSEVGTHPMGKDVAGDAHLIVLGEPVLRRYYTVFDWDKESVGFAVAAVERSCPRLARALLPTGTGCTGALDEEVEDQQIVLAQQAIASQHEET